VNTAKVDAKGNLSNMLVTDTDDTCVIINTIVPIIKIDKRDANPDDKDGIV
jgi:hypothetical protein